MSFIAKARAAFNSVNPTYWYDLYEIYYWETRLLHEENERLRERLYDAEKRLQEADFISWVEHGGSTEI